MLNSGWKRFLLLLLIATSVRSDRIFHNIRGPLFTQEPPESVEFSNSTGAVIPCTVEGQPQPSLRWEKRDGTIVSSIAGIRQVRQDNTLVFFPVGPEKYRQEVHSAVYRCVASNIAGSIRSRDVHVKAVLQQPYEIHVSDHFVIRGNTAVLQCVTPPAVRSFVKVVLWLRDDGVRIGKPGMIGEKHAVLPTGELLIRNVGSSDEIYGYQCQVHNLLLGENKMSTTAGKLTVREAHTPVSPRITEPKPIIRGQESEQLYIPCIAQGFPNPSYRWGRKDGERFLPLLFTERMMEKNGILIIQRAAVQDKGIYVCVANNSVGEDRAETKVLISVPLSSKIDPEIQTVDVGKIVTLTCRIVGHPVHSVVWLKNGKTLSATGSIALVTRDIVQITSVKTEDAGMYQCFVSNDQEVTQSAAQLFVIEDAPIFTSTFTDQVVHPGTPVSLKCSASGNPLPQVTWKLDEVPVPEAYHIRIGDYVSDERTVNSYVNISSTKVEDGGTYKCIARNGVRHIEHAARLNVYGPPFIRPMPNITALSGHGVIIHCPVSGYPISRIFWERGNIHGRSLPQNHRQKTFPNGTLIIEELKRSDDGGMYHCIAENNRSRTARRDVSLSIMAPPVVQEFYFPTDLSEGKRASVACVVAAGDLPIRISWEKDGRPLPEELRGTITMATEFTSLLSFNSVTQLHNGNYTCVVSNPVASTNFTATMVVRVPPKWRTEPSDRSVIMGQPVMFDCQANGYPDPVIRWKKAVESSKTDFQVIISNENVQILENGSLVIREVTKEDSGNYMCQATNDVGSGLSTVVHLKVHVAAHFEQKFKALTLTRGQSATLTCRAIGEKPITLSWTKDRRPFDPSFEPRYVHTERLYSEGVEAIIKIPSANRKDSALFTCVAQNIYGRDDANFQVVVQEPPDRPSSLDISTRGSRSVSVSWSTPYSGNSVITKFVIEYKEAKEPWSGAKEAVVDSQDSMFTIQSLSPKTTYEVRVRADNIIGSGDFSDPITFATEGEAPSAPPRDVRAIATSSRTIQVTWKPPLSDEQYSAVDGYYIGYKTQSSEQYSYKTMQVGDSGILECEITTLNKFTQYQVIVQAFNSKGAGPTSEHVTVHTLEYDPPSAPSLRLISATSSSIHLAWDLSEENYNPVSGYILFQKSETPDWEEVQLPDERLSFTFHGLQCGKRYQFYIVAFNNVGRGQPSDVISAQTEGTIPIPPEKTDLLAINSTFITIHLTSWKSGGCSINFFVVQYKALNHPEWILKSNNILPEQQTVTLPDLAPASYYILLMSAHNDAGTAEAEYVFATLTLAGATLPPPTSSVDTDREFFHQLKIIIPIACTTVVLVLIITVACVVLIRKRHTTPEDCSNERDMTKSVDTVPMTVWEKGGRGEQRLSHSREQLYFPAPYATSRISMYSGDGDPDAQHHHQQHQQQQQHLQQQQQQQQQQQHHHHQQQHHHTWRSEERDHTYDVPFLPRQTVVPCSEGEQHPGDIHAAFTARHLYLNPAIVELPPDGTMHSEELSLIQNYDDIKVQQFLYTKANNRPQEVRAKHKHRPHRIRRTLVRRNDIDSENEEATYYLSDPETSPSPGESFEFSEAECDMPWRLTMKERPV